MLESKNRIRAIKARGNMVALIDDTGEELFSRKEALWRAQAIIGTDHEAQHFVEALIKAACEAKVNEDGEPYPSHNVELLLKTAKEGDKSI